MIKTGILGGTFNPVHTGHIDIARQVYEKLMLDRVLFIPTGISYRKLDLKVLPKEIRYALVELAVSAYPYFECSDVELKKDGYSYTCDTLSELHEIYPDNEFYYIIGTDNLFEIEKWNEPEIIFGSCRLVVYSRNDYDNALVADKKKELEYKYGADIIILDDVSKIDISSTYIRECFINSNFDKAKDMLDEKTYEYIVKNKLYEFWTD